MIKKIDRNKAREARHARVRNKVTGTSNVPRLNVFRSNSNIFAQIIDDEASKTLVSASSIDKELKLEFLSEKDKSDILFGIEQGVDFIALSFVSRAQDVIDTKNFLKEHGGEHIEKIVEAARGEFIVAEFVLRVFVLNLLVARKPSVRRIILLELFVVASKAEYTSTNS